MNSYMLDELNEWYHKRSLRFYQWLIVNKIEFLFEGEGKFISCTTKRGINELSFGKNDKQFLILSSGIGRGYLLLPSERKISKKINRRLEGVIVKTGHGNFAHFIWNQLSALIQIKDIDNIYFYQESNSILNLSDAGFVNILEKNIPINSYNTLYIGSQYVSIEAQRLLNTYIRRYGVNLFDKKKEGKKYIYLGVRGPGTRALSNEIDFYVELIHKLNAELKGCYFFLDGFSFQNNNIEKVNAINRCNRNQLLINDIISRLKINNVLSINGWRLVDFLSFAKNIDFYVTHEGTMQHKIGWIYPQKLGLILVGGNNPKCVSTWHSNQVEGSREIAFLDKINFEKVGTQEVERNNQFRLVDVVNAVNCATSHIVRELE